MPSAFVTSALLVATLSSCQPSEDLFAVDLRTDLVVGVEFDGVRSTLDGVRVEHHVPEPGDYLSGIRIANFEGVASGRHELSVEVLADARIVLSRSYVLELAPGSSGMTALLTRDCRSFSCPGNQTCQNARCVSPVCTVEEESTCEAETSCSADEDCASLDACAVARCLDGACFQEDGGACGDGEYCDPELGCRTALVTPLVCQASGTIVWSNIDETDASMSGSGDVVVGSEGLPIWYFNTDTGQILARETEYRGATSRIVRPESTGSNPDTGIAFQRLSSVEPREGYGLFTMERLEIPENTKLVGLGSRVLAILAKSDVIILGELTVAANEEPARPGPGPGGALGQLGVDGAGLGGGFSAGDGPEIHGGGASYGGLGGAAGAETEGDSGAPGARYGNDALVPLLGGSAGGAGVVGAGGHGGGAVQLMARGRLVVGNSGVIHAGGGGGMLGIGGAGGAGSGGAILLEAPVVEMHGAIGVNGGAGGGSGCGVVAGGDPLTVPALSRCGGGNGSDALGNAQLATDRGSEESDGGGGGGAGRIRINSNVAPDGFRTGFLPILESGLVTFGRLGECP